MKPVPAADVSLASLTTLELGGPARWVFTPENEAEVAEIHAWARREGCPLFVLGGGSNVVVADAGFGGAVVRGARLRGIHLEERAGEEVWVTAAAGEPWDDLVTLCVQRGLAGIECLAGIPGLVGATPIQNVGAYGQEVGDTLREVRVLELGGDGPDTSGEGPLVTSMDREACGLGYRDSLFRRQPGRFVILSVTLALRRGGPPTVRYAELASALAGNPGAASAPSLARVRETVRDLRRGKSMLLEPGDPNRRSVGSFFTNPVVSPEQALAVATRALAGGQVTEVLAVPSFPLPNGRVKLSAGWLIERAGFPRGTRHGAVGVSSRHALALVHHGGGTTAELVALAREIRDAVAATFGVTLLPEPIFLGTNW